MTQTAQTNLETIMGHIDNSTYTPLQMSQIRSALELSPEKVLADILKRGKSPVWACNEMARRMFLPQGTKPTESWHA
jgi:hypothetical protein